MEKGKHTADQFAINSSLIDTSKEYIYKNISYIFPNIIIITMLIFPDMIITL